MNLSKTDAKVLAFLIEHRERITLTELAKQLNIKKNNLGIYIKKLEKYRLITVSRVGRTKQVSGSYTHFLGFSKVKEKLPNLRLEDILTGKISNILAYLQWYVATRFYQKKSIYFRISDIKLPGITTRRILKKLSSLGIVYQPSKSWYSTRKESKEALRFCSEILTEIYVAEAEYELNGIIGTRISFDNPENAECIFITEKENTPTSYWPTAYSILSRYGIRLIGAGRYYYSNIKPKIIDVAIHMLAVYNDTRSIMYVCALLIKHPFDYHKLLKKGNQFGISDKFISNLIEFIETKGQKSQAGFPSWDEVDSMVRAYQKIKGVSNG